MTVDPWIESLLELGPRALMARMAAGHPVDPAVLADAEYHGISLAQPSLVEWLTWRTFKKVFRREEDGSLRGWNVAVEQRGIHGPQVDRMRDGKRVTYGHYGVRDGTTDPSNPFGFGLLIDYGLGARGLFNPQRRVRDPLVALAPGRSDVLLGYSYADLGVGRLDLPTFFSLQRGAPLAYDVAVP